MRTLILTPNKEEMCGMYQLAKDLAKEFDGRIMTKQDFTSSADYHRFQFYSKVISLLHPMHKIAERGRSMYGFKWICYDQGIPPVNQTYFPNFWRRQAMRYINWRNNQTMKGADEYWNVTEREQKPRWTEKTLELPNEHNLSLFKYGYAIYLGRQTDYKNYNWLEKTTEELGIELISSNNWSDEETHKWLSNTKILVTASLWEGYGRSVMEAEALGIPAVAYDVGAHKRHIKKGICVPLDLNNMKKSEEDFKKAVLEVWQRETNKKPN